MQIQSKQSGFTLVELVIVIALLIILASFALPSYQKMTQDSLIRTAAESIQNGLQIARGEAVKRNANVQLDLRGTDSAWTVCVSPAGGGACPNPDDATTIQSRAVGDGSSTNVDVTVSDASAAGPFVFNGLGVMASPAPTAVSGIISIDVKNGASAGSRDLRVAISVGGSSKNCDPALAASDPRSCP